MSNLTTDAAGVHVLPDDALGIKFSDTLDIDQEARLLYMGDNWAGGIDVFELRDDGPRFVTTIRTKGQFSGVCVAKAVHKVYAGMTGGRIAVIDIDPKSRAFHTITATIDTGARGHVDLLEFVAPHAKLYGALRNDGFVTVVDVGTDEIIATIAGLGGALEQPRFNVADGMVYLTGQADNVLYQIDPARDVVTATFEIGDDCAPNGMAINPIANQAVIACSDRAQAHSVIWDFTTQQVADVTYETGRADGVIYSAAVDRFFLAGGGFPSGPVVGVFGGDPVAFLGNVPTRRGASWAAFDEQEGMIYAPTIEAGKPALLGVPLPPELQR